MKYTKGPWFIMKHTKGLMISGEGKQIADVYDPRKTRDANARLIAASPELLEVCKDFTVFDWENSNRSWTTIAMWLLRFQQAISKAEAT